MLVLSFGDCLHLVPISNYTLVQINLSTDSVISVHLDISIFSISTRLSSDVEKCQSDRFDWQIFIGTEKKFNICAAYFNSQTDKKIKITPIDQHVQKDFDISETHPTIACNKQPLIVAEPRILIACLGYPPPPPPHFSEHHILTLGDFSISTKHILQLPAMDSLSW